MEITSSKHDCPYCKEHPLKVIQSEKQIHGYYCPSCKSVFDFGWHVSLNKKMSWHVLKRRNPNFLQQLNSNDPMENIKKEAELRSNGESLHSDFFIIDKKEL